MQLKTWLWLALCLVPLTASAQLAKPDGTLATAGVDYATPSGVGVPSGMIAFTALACPSGWTEYTAARGYAIVGLPSGGTAAGTVGTALTNLQDKTHAHTYTQVVNHVHGVSTILRTATTGGATTQVTNAPDTSSTADTTRKTDNPDGGVTTGTTATAATSDVMPYLQLRACVKN